MELDPKFLKAFRAVADCGSFTAAGKMLGMTQSAVSQNIRALEKELGAALLIRSNRLVGLTPAGEIFLRSVRQVLDQLEQARSLVSEYSDGGGGRLRIGAPADACRWLLSPIIAELRRRLPGTELLVHTGDNATNRDRLVACELDFALLHGPVRNNSFAMVEIGRDELVILVPPDHLLARHESLTAEELRDQPMILPAQAAGDSPPWNNFLIEGGVFPRIAVETDSLELAKQLVLDGLGVTIAPRWAVQAEVGRGELNAVGFGRVGLWRNWYGAYPQANRLTAQGRTFLRVCGQRLPRLFAASSHIAPVLGPDPIDARRTNDA
jgi:DNA-binding transcriptional LysR family regulator